MTRYGAEQIPTAELLTLRLSIGLSGENTGFVPALVTTIWRCAGIVVGAHPATYVDARCGFGQGYSFEGDPRAERERNRSSAKMLA